MLLLVLEVVVYRSATLSGAQVKNAPVAEKPVVKPAPYYYGAGECKGCHAKGNDPPQVIDAICDCKEYLIWEQDKHAVAYRKLKEPRAKNMGQLLGNKDVTDPKTGCVSCHSVAVPDAQKSQQSKQFPVVPGEGVSCVACHGFAKEWIIGHGLGATVDDWRAKNRVQKETEGGMIDLWDPAKRTAMCVSCHVGNAQEGKIVTHEMYAAGHPPLPSIEVASFSEQMPRHWQYLATKTNPKVRDRLTKSGIDLGQTPFERSMLVLVSGVATFKAQMELLAREAVNVKSEHTLDYTHFDCYSCHHELRKPSARREPRFRATPGRPSYREWPMPLLKLAMHQTSHKDEELNGKLKTLHEAFADRPFGNPQAIANAATGIVDWATKLQEQVAGVKLNEAKSLALLKELCAIATLEQPDYDSARQLAWAFRVIKEEWDPMGKNSAGLNAVILKLNIELKLDLPSGPERSIVDDLKLALPNRANFDHASFKKRFGELASALPSQ